MIFILKIMNNYVTYVYLVDLNCNFKMIELEFLKKLCCLNCMRYQIIN